jgi:hypothetical protein
MGHQSGRGRIEMFCWYFYENSTPVWRQVEEVHLHLHRNLILILIGARVTELQSRA